MMSWVQPMTTSSPPPSHYAVDTSNNLATDRFDPHRTWATQTTLATRALAQEVATMGDMGVPRQLPYSVLPSVSGSAPKVQKSSPSPADSTNGLHNHAISTFSRQINLATGSNSRNSLEHGCSQYEYPADFHSSFGPATYQPYVDNSTAMQIGGANTQAQDFGYGYTEPPTLTQPSDGVAQTDQRFGYNDFQPGPEGSYLDAQPLNELYPADDHTNSFPIEYPYHSAGTFLVRRASAMSLQESETQPQFLISFGTPIAEDTWSSAAFSSPSLASFNSSPPSTQHDSSALGTPAQGFEDTPVSHGEPLLNHSISYSISDLRHLSNSPPRSDSSSTLHSRRGAIDQRGLSVVPSQSSSSSLPFLDDTVAHQIYAEGFELEDVSDCSPAPPTPERGSTPATSPSTSTGFDYPQASGISTGSPKPPMRGNTARGTPPGNDSSHVVPLIRQPSSKSADGRGQSGGSRHHPYGRSSRISAHEQVIQFDTPTNNISTTSALDHTEPDGRKPKKKSKGSKRVYCGYICPLKQEPCGQSVSREADMSRHMQRHRRAEETMVRDGLLPSDQQTNFENLKADEITLCKRCGETLSRKDALRRHLKNAGKACRSFYPEIIIVD